VNDTVRVVYGTKPEVLSDAEIYAEAARGQRVWLTDEIRSKIETDQPWLERALLALYARQTRDEQDSEETLLLNNVGFTGADAPFLTYCAKWVESGKHLSGRFLDDVRRRMVKYVGQLTRIANGQA
jgi:hypothetical protein